uniref:Ig-like domain-containing protein n=1 Tax=Oryzias latipes TaxID=8090 RepID=A0A3P9KCD2_ORYLA
LRSVATLLFTFPHFTKHSLEYFCTAASGVKEFPEFVGVATVDKDFVGSCSMIIHRKEPKHTVIKKFFEENSKEMRMYFLECQDNERFYASKHVLQQHSGCEWDDETGETKSFNRYAYDGEDFPKLDLLKHEWTALTEKALIFFFSVVLPSVSLLQRSNSSLVSCHATGFFPDMVDLFWMKDGEEFHEDVEKGEILPHNDETFQMSIYLNTSSLPLTDWKKFSCVFQLFRNQKNITISLDKTKIRTNKATYVKNTDSFIRGWGVGAAVVILVTMGVSGSNMFKHLMNLQSCLLTQKFCSAFIYAYIIQFFLIL